MKPGRIKFATRALGAPEGWDREKHGECEVLEIRDRDGCMESAWVPTEEEKAAIAAGCSVTLTVWGSSHPPVSVNVKMYAPRELAPGEDPPDRAVEITAVTDERRKYIDPATGSIYVGEQVPLK